MISRRYGLLLVLAVSVALAAPSSAGAWQYKFQDFFAFQQGSIATSVITAKKCNGGMLGNYDFRSFVSSESGGQTSIEIEVEARMPVTNQSKPMKNVTVAVTGSIEPAFLEEARNALFNFFSSVNVKYKPDKLIFEHGPLVIFGAQTVAAGTDKTKFKPKPGC
jgi:hypothetical protein